MRYLSLTPNYHVYDSLKFLILMPAAFMAAALYMIFKVFPKYTNSDNKLFMVLISKLV